MRNATTNNSNAKAPHFSKTASGTSTRKVTNARVIVAKTALYRGSVISGTFEVAEGSDVHTHTNIVARWFGWVPARGTLRVTLIDYTVREKYTGEVTADFGIAS